MKKIMDWVKERVTPVVDKIGSNVWLAATQEAILACVPATLVSSVASLFSTLSSLGLTFLPDLTYLNTFSFGMFGLFLSYLLPATILEKKRHRNVSKQAGLAGIGLFLILLFPTFEWPLVGFPQMNMGAGGMLNALVSGYITAIIFNFFADHPIIKEDSGLPSFITTWFTSIIPWTIVLLLGQILVVNLNFDLIEAVRSLLMPITKFSSSIWGYIIIVVLCLFFYSFGISAWIIYPLMSLIWNECHALNLEQVAAGLTPTHAHIYEVFQMAFIGGQGSTLALCLFMAFLAKSKKCKTVGRAALLPSIFGINEPVVYGAPVAFNPILMIPFWLGGFANAMIVWFGFSSGFVPIPTEPFRVTLPSIVYSYLATNSINGLILHLIAFAATVVIYYPFFKVYDNNCLADEKAVTEK